MVTNRDLIAEIETPIKIFVGTEEEQILAVKVLEYSIKKHATMSVEVTPLFAAIRQKGINVPEPQDPKIRPRTPFSFQRFAIPELKDYRGKAIYLDSDMLVFQDIKALWLWEFNGADLLSVYEPSDSGRPPQFSVMVLNCQQLQWDVEKLVRNLEAGKWTYKQFVLEMAPAQKVAAVLPSQWNDLERYSEGETALTHYTDMPSQPWLKTHNPLGWVWCQELFNAIEDGFISKKFIREEVQRGWVRPSLIYQIEHQIIDPLKLPKSVIKKDKLEFTPPHEMKKFIKNIAVRMQPNNPIRQSLNKCYSLSRYIWDLAKTN